jgi:hypothetical protein
MLVAVVATLAMTVSYLDRQTLSAIAPTVRSELGISHTELGWLGSGFAFAYLVFSPISGRLVDRIGPRRTLAAAFVGMVAGLGDARARWLVRVALRAACPCSGRSSPPRSRPRRGPFTRTCPPARRSAATGLLFTGSSIGAMNRSAPRHLPHARVRLPEDLRAHGGDRRSRGCPCGSSSRRRTTPTARRRRRPRSPVREVLGHRAFVRQALVVLGSAPAILVVLSWYPPAPPRDVRRAEARRRPLPVGAPRSPSTSRPSRSESPRHAGTRTAKDAHHAHPRSARPWRPSRPPPLALVPLVGSAWGKVALGSVSLAGGAGMYVVGTSRPPPPHRPARRRARRRPLGRDPVDRARRREPDLRGRGRPHPTRGAP